MPVFAQCHLLRESFFDPPNLKLCSCSLSSFSIALIIWHTLSFTYLPFVFSNQSTSSIRRETFTCSVLWGILSSRIAWHRVGNICWMNTWIKKMCHFKHNQLGTTCCLKPKLFFHSALLCRLFWNLMPHSTLPHPSMVKVSMSKPVSSLCFSL